MKKNIFKREPFSGKEASFWCKKKNVQAMMELFILLEKYFIPKLYKTEGITNAYLHEFTPVCLLVFLPKKEGKVMLAASIENGILTTGKKHLVGQSIKIIANRFFRALFTKGLEITFETSITFFAGNPNPNTSKKMPTGRMQNHKVSFTFVFSETAPIIKDLVVETSKMQVTDRKTLEA